MTSSISTKRGQTSKTDIIARFPLEGRSPRPSQEAYIRASHAAFESGAKFVILEAPVGSGKSAALMTLALQYGSSHTLTPRKALQDQYFEDFHKFNHMMKGKSAYPCTRSNRGANAEVYSEINKGRTPDPGVYSHGVSVQMGWCGSLQSRFKQCNETAVCPYAYAGVVAETKPHIIHNIFGFLFQTNLANKFTPRDLLGIDEAHDLEANLREYLTVELAIDKRDLELPTFETVEQIIDFFSQDKFLPRDKDDLEKYVDSILRLEKWSGKEDLFVVDARRDYGRTYVRIIPRRVHFMAEELLWKFGRKVVLMSGTVYDKSDFCRRLGIPEDDAVFIRVESDFPIKYRPIILKQEYQVDTSHAKWDENFPRLVASIDKILCKMNDVKGLIHVPSYLAGEALMSALRAKHGRRLIAHNKEDFQATLKAFYDSPDPFVFMSPSCTQGVDFKDDRARFQIIVRVPWPNAGDKFTNVQMKDDFYWYNLQALRVFGQQLGRINRHEKDFGVTILIDSRFESFIRRNRNLLPKDVLAAIQRD